MPLSIDQRTAADLKRRKAKDKGHLCFNYTTKVLKMACHESIKDLLHKTLGLNDAGFPDTCDSRITLELSSTAEMNMAKLKRYWVYILLCSCGPVTFRKSC